MMTSLATPWPRELPACGAVFAQRLSRLPSGALRAAAAKPVGLHEMFLQHRSLDCSQTSITALITTHAAVATIDQDCSPWRRMETSCHLPFVVCSTDLTPGVRYAVRVFSLGIKR